MGVLWAGVIRVSDMNKRDAGSDRFHAKREQTEALTGATPAGDNLEILPAELDVSGGNVLTKRPALNAAVQGVEAGRYAGIIVAYQSRLGRDVETEEQVWRRVEAAGGRIILAIDGIDATTVDGRMVRRIRSAMNHAERERHVVAFDKRRQYLTERGVWQARNVPIGYRKNPETRKLEPDPEASAVVLAAFESRAAGSSIRDVAMSVGRAPSATASMLRSRTYLGEMRCGPYENPVSHPAIVPVDTWLRSQHVGTPSGPPRAQAGKSPSLLLGLVVCASCGGAMGPAGKPRSYACRVVRSNGACEHPAAVSVAKLDEMVASLVRPYLFDLDAQTTGGGGRVESARADLSTAEAERDAFAAAVTAAGMSASALGAALRLRQDKVVEAERDLANALTAEGAEQWNGSLVDLWDAGTVEQRRRVLSRVLEGVLVERAGGRGSQRPLADRARVLALGAGVIRRGSGCPLPNRDAEGVLREDLVG